MYDPGVVMGIVLLRGKFMELGGGGAGGGIP